MKLKSGDFFFFLRSFCGKQKNQGGDQRKKWRKRKHEKKVNGELFIVEFRLEQSNFFSHCTGGKMKILLEKPAANNFKAHRW